MKRLLVLSALALLACAPAAAAESFDLQVSTTEAHLGDAVTITASGVASVPVDVPPDAEYIPPDHSYVQLDVFEGAAACDDRSGGSVKRWSLEFETPRGQNRVQGPFSQSWTFTPTVTGPYLVCGSMSVGEGQMTATRAFTTAPASAEVAPPTGTVTVSRKRVPTVTVTVSGRTDVRSLLRVDALTKNGRCTAPGDNVLSLAPAAPAARLGSKTDLGDAFRNATWVGPGAFNVLFSARDRQLSSTFYGRLEYPACVWLGTPLQDVNSTGISGDHYLQQTTIAAPSSIVGMTLAPLAPAMLDVVSTAWTHPPVTLMDFKFRGCKNDVHAFSGVSVSRRTRRFGVRLTFKGGTHGRISGRFARGYKQVSGRLTMKGCAFSFSRKARKLG
jgi:hypothetical protein